MLETYDITHRALTAQGLAVTRARDLMSALTLLRIDGAVYTATVSETGTMTIEIQCHIEELGNVAIHLAPSWVKTEGPTARNVKLKGAQSSPVSELWFVKYIVALTNE
jgi:hypothetical protein